MLEPIISLGIFDPIIGLEMLLPCSENGRIVLCSRTRDAEELIIVLLIVRVVNGLDQGMRLAP